MVWFRRMCVAVAVGAALTVFTAPASAQSEITYSLAGVEIAATSTQGTFVGVAISPDDFGKWGAVVLHQPLDDTALITGGSFAVDGQRAYVEVGTTQAYVGGFTLVKPENGERRFEPAVQTVSSGVIINARATVSSTR